MTGAFPYAVTRTFGAEEPFQFIIADPVGAEWYAGESQVMKERLWAQDHIKPGMRVVDAGCHHGMNTVLFARWVGARGHVRAYDAVPYNAAVVIQNLFANRLTFRGEAYAFAISDHEGTVRVNASTSNAMVGGDGGMVVQCARLDYLERHPVDFLKLDVEGHEVAALKGAKRILRSRPTLLIELHCFAYRNRLQTVREIAALLPAKNWTWEWQARPDDDIVPMEKFDPELLAAHDNPHVYGVPKPKRWWQR